MGCTCLVVDDSRVVRRYARGILETNGYTVTEAENGRIALEDCRRARPDGVLLDWHMPVMNGIEFLRALRREFGPERPVVVFCTAQAEMTAIELAIESGAQEYIMKPFDAGILLGKLAQVGLR
jgi:two-component system chemotaxis response regulator CheY